MPTGERQKEKITFLIQIQYRQNSSWQGRIVWLDAKRTMIFRSFLELVSLMQEAIGSEVTVDYLKAWENRQEAK